jgi:uncharacterized protein (TIGR02453 family)
MAFRGFLDQDGKFFGKLAKNQTREWFLANKATFEEGWHAPMKLLLAEVFALVDDALPYCDLEDPKVFRIYRDVRFSKDKAPYKTNIGGTIPLKGTGKVTEVPIALYFHVGYQDCFAASGNYMMDGATLKRFRDALVDQEKGAAFAAIVRKLDKQGFSLDSHETAKRIPKGYDPAHPHAEHLRRKGLTVTFPKTPKELLTSPKLVSHLAKHVKTAAPLVEWLYRM